MKNYEKFVESVQIFPNSVVLFFNRGTIDIDQLSTRSAQLISFLNDDNDPINLNTHENGFISELGNNFKQYKKIELIKKDNIVIKVDDNTVSKIPLSENLNFDELNTNEKYYLYNYDNDSNPDYKLFKYSNDENVLNNYNVFFETDYDYPNVGDIRIFIRKQFSGMLPEFKTVKDFFDFITAEAVLITSSEKKYLEALTSHDDNCIITVTKSPATYYGNLDIAYSLNISDHNCSYSIPVTDVNPFDSLKPNIAYSILL